MAALSKVQHLRVERIDSLTIRVLCSPYPKERANTKATHDARLVDCRTCIKMIMGGRLTR